MSRFAFGAIALALALGNSIVAADLRPLEDAPLFAVQFVDTREGWAAGADGVIWHSIDGGQHWERQPTGTRAILRSVCFVNPYVGWAVGREELPHGGGSNGIVLHTRNGGLKWTRLADGAMPGLNVVRFFDEKMGIAAGDGSEREPSGLWLTRDGGLTWSPAPGPRCPTWRCADFRDITTGALGGAWGRLAAVSDGVFNPADVDKLGGRNVLGLRLSGQRGVAVGQGGLVLLSQDSAGLRWGFADLRLPPELLDCLDFHAAACLDKRIWIAGQPGAVVWHSPDFGQTWTAQSTGQSLPLFAVQFLDAANGWAVGDCGTILGTADGGKTWTVQRRGAQRAAVSFVHARPADQPLETVALLGADEGYITAALQVTSPDPATADFKRATESDRWLAAQRKVGGAAAATIGSFPLPPQLVDADRPDLTRAWDQRLRTSSARHLVRLLTLQLRTWRPEVVVTGYAKTPLDGLVSEALREAFDCAGDPQAFPEQIATFKLEPWMPKKLFTIWNVASATGAMVNADEPRRRLGEWPREFAATAYHLLTDRPTELPTSRYFRLVGGKLPAHDLMAEITLAAGGTARRAAPTDEPDAEQLAEIEKSQRERRNLQALSRPDWGKLTDSGALLAQIGPVLANLPADQGATAAYSLAHQYAQAGQWHLAREAFLLMVDKYPGHPLAADAYRWLVRYHASSEARRREELGQFLVLTTTDVRQASGVPTRDDPARTGAGIKTDRPVAEMTADRQAILLTYNASARRWFEGALAVEPRLAAFGPRVAEDPTVQFALNAARRQLGDVDHPKSWLRSFLLKQGPPGPQGANPWRENAAAELWLLERNGPAPKPVTNCRQIKTKPYLDGELNDVCWQDMPPLVLKDPAGATTEQYETKVWLAYDAEYLYVALSCRHPADRHVAPVEKRVRDADLRAFDRVSLMLDLDRDYQTYFHWQIDQRGAVAEDCWGDHTWSPRWLVAHKSTADGWSAELALPLAEITGDTVPLGKAWCLNVVRILPGRGMQAFSQPADVTPRPEGMGLVIFTADAKR
jgi:photosystem II stability/assembly factor-like uncharacterized protein